MKGRLVAPLMKTDSRFVAIIAKVKDTERRHRRCRQNTGKAKPRSGREQNWHGLCNVIIPSYSSDLKRLNETGIRHDVRRNIELGFWGALLVSEAATTDAEYIEFMEIAVDEAKGKHNFLFHGCFDTVEDVVRLAQSCREHRCRWHAAGAPALVLSAEREGTLRLYRIRLQPDRARRRRLCSAALEFQRLHPSGYPPKVMLEAAKLENLVACKFEVGGIAGHYDFWLQLKGTECALFGSDGSEFPGFGGAVRPAMVGHQRLRNLRRRVPKLFKLLRDGKHDEAMEQYWRVDPVRQIRTQLSAYMSGAHFINRSLWKYWAWLNGYNGGPMRQPVNKINDRRDAAIARGDAARRLRHQG